MKCLENAKYWQLAAQDWFELSQSAKERGDIANSMKRHEHASESYLRAMTYLGLMPDDQLYS